MLRVAAAKMYAFNEWCLEERQQVVSVDEYRKILENLAVADLRADLISDDPECCTTEEIIMATTYSFEQVDAADAAMHDSFSAMPPQMQQRMLDILAEHSTQSREWWADLLGNE